ncbi:MAG TPA: cupredoxin domain-containing protein [Candidatus Limnocylindrales bacterium]|jgi:plastocyanin
MPTPRPRLRAGAVSWRLVPFRLGLVRAAAFLAVASSTTACTASSSPGWTYAPAPSVASAAPAASGAASAAASGPASAAASVIPSAVPSAAAAAPSSSPSGAPSGAVGAQLQLVAKNITFDKKDLSAAAGQAFQIVLDNEDAGVPHNVWIKDATGNIILKDDFFSGVDTRTYDVPALQAATYTFYCSVHNIAAMTGTLTVH